MRRRFQIGMGVNPSLIINKGIYIQHVDGGLYTKLGCRYRSNGATMAASYVLDEINNSKVCTMGGNPISCTISNSGQYIQAYFNEGQVTGDIILQFTIGDVFYYFFITEGSNQVPQLKLSPSTHLIYSIYKISTIGSFVPIDTYVEL